MAEIQSLYVRVLGDITDLRKKMSKAEKVTEEFGYRTQRVGKALTAGLTLPIAAAGAAATKLASDAEEAANKFEVVMGDSAERVRKRFEELHKTIPLTTHEMEGLSATVQDLLVPMGVARDSAADMSARFVELAGDLGSFNNMAPAEVLRAFTSALAGEAEPVRRFGVDVRVARLETLALEMGLIEAGEELNRTARAMAVLEAITRDSTDAIGDAARTADSAANQFKFFLRNVKELGVTIGDQLLPVVTPLVQKVNELLEGADALNSSTMQWVIAVTTVTAVLGPLLLIIGKVTQAAVGLRVALMSMGLASGPAGWVVLGIGAIAAALGGLATMWTKNQIEAAAYRAEVERIQRTGLSGLSGEQLQSRIQSTTEARDAANRRLAALRIDMGPNSTTTVSRERLQEEYNRELADAIRLQGELTRLRREATRRQTIGGVSGGPPAFSEPWIFQRIRQRDLSGLAIGTSGEGGLTKRGGFPGSVSMVGRAPSTFPDRFDPRTGTGSGLGQAGQQLAMFGGATGAGQLAGLGSMISQLATPVGIAGVAIKGLSSILETTADSTRRFAESLQQLSFRFEFLDIDDSGEQFRQTLDLLISQIGSSFGDIDLSQLTPENFDQYAAQIERFLSSFGGDAGPTMFEHIFGISLEQARDAFGRLESAADNVTESFNAMSRAINAPQGFKVALERFRATDVTSGTGGGGGGGGGWGGGGGGRGGRGGGGIGPGIEFNIYQQPGEDGESLARRVLRGIDDLASQGNPTAMKLSLSPAGVE